MTVVGNIHSITKNVSGKWVYRGETYEHLQDAREARRLHYLSIGLTEYGHQPVKAEDRVHRVGGLKAEDLQTTPPETEDEKAHRLEQKKLIEQAHDRYVRWLGKDKK